MPIISEWAIPWDLDRVQLWSSAHAHSVLKPFFLPVPRSLLTNQPEDRGIVNYPPTPTPPPKKPLSRLFAQIERHEFQDKIWPPFMLFDSNVLFPTPLCYSRKSDLACWWKVLITYLKDLTLFHLFLDRISFFLKKCVPGQSYFVVFMTNHQS